MQCIECASPATQLFREFPGGVIQIAHCSFCNQIIDKYVECDAVLILLDALLQKAQAYRHLLFNSADVRRTVWKLLLILLICDAYIKRDNLWPREEATSTSAIFDAALEWQFYSAFVLCVIEEFMFVLCVLLLTYITFYFTTQVKTPAMLIINALIVSSSGKLLAILAMVWGQTHSLQYLLLTKCFVFTSNVTAFKVVSQSNRLQAIIVIGLSQVMQTCASDCFVSHFYDS
ncbi:hypothetical protein CAPTEDRAFT_92876 [Capitella teleta]|uniref:Protein ARV n=1 Tax=Capitella teleta TaxID=283909 RepID=R7VH78_CAPTE|nr:hypothetical protein CAPTEDRAFT_92876 [Capitella teleta]|eukprot:ELU15651.1 hypothetical protein CAPTEDRAFT_92876 [Capitella teleta]